MLPTAKPAFNAMLFTAKTGIQPEGTGMVQKGLEGVVAARPALSFPAAGGK